MTVNRGVDLKKHKRFQRQKPWDLIRKILLFLGVGFAIYYGLKQLEEQQNKLQKQNIPAVSTQVDIDHD